LLTTTIGTISFNKRKSEVRVVHEEHAVTAVIQYKRRERAIPSNAEICPVHPLVSTTEPVFIFDGPYSNTVAVRASAVKHDDVQNLVGFTVDLDTCEIDFDSIVEFLPSEACVLAVDYSRVTQVLQRKLKEWRNTQDKVLQTRKQK
jgi:hypothetical protein